MVAGFFRNAGPKPDGAQSRLHVSACLRGHYLDNNLEEILRSVSISARAPVVLCMSTGVKPYVH